MKNGLRNNGLSLQHIKSESKHIDNINSLEDIKNYIKKESDVVAFLDNEVIIGRYERERFKFPEQKNIEFKYINRMRIFNENEELHIWRSNGIIKGRYRSDGDGNETDIVESYQVISGTTAKKPDDYTRLIEEKKGIELLIPGEWKADDKETRVALKTRHYIEYLQGYQASYSDARMVNFVQMPKKGVK